jgi:hypothetical protein
VKSMLIKWIRDRRIKQFDVIVREQTELQDPSSISIDPNESIVSHICESKTVNMIFYRQTFALQT